MRHNFIGILDGGIITYISNVVKYSQFSGAQMPKSENWHDERDMVRQ